ncbi:MAG: glycoside hydrolase family 3 N-terminal domain-containing protein [Fibrobacterota bacterium]
MSDKPLYLDSTMSPSERAEDLVSRMTLEEKAAQLCQLDGRYYEKVDNEFLRKNAGSYLHMTNPETTRQAYTENMETRFKIPTIIAMDCIHGHALKKGATVFPTQLSLSSSWNPELARIMARITAREASANGIHWTFSPVFCVARDMRWGRVNETFGEDIHLIGEMGKATVEGYQGEKLSDKDSILACAKHYAGYSETQGGRDSSEADLSIRKLRAGFLPQFKKAVESGAATFMTAYQSIDGEPCVSNRWLLTEVLRDEWGFKGFVVTDWNCTGTLVTKQFTCATYEEASVKAIEAGNDMIMVTPEFFEASIKAVKSGSLKEELIDNACRNILIKKFELGLFEDRREPDEEKMKTLFSCPEHREEALKSARESIVLLKNSRDLLPLNKEKIKKIAVIGPNADNTINQLGDWSYGSGQILGSGKEEGHPRENIVTVLDGIKKSAGESIEVTYCKGCGITDGSASELGRATECASNADIAVVVVGDDISEHGEGADRANLDLSGKQKELVRKVFNTGTPVILVLINSKPLCIGWESDRVDAVIEAWNPGMEGGTALAEIIFGDTNPSGKLTVSFPRHSGQHPVYYDQYPGWHNPPDEEVAKYLDLPVGPVFPFGFGLSYTKWEYSELIIKNKKLSENEDPEFSVVLKNTGERDGFEVVQVYINDIVSSLTTPVKQLKAFKKIFLKKGESATLDFKIPFSELAMTDRQGNYVVEPGDFELLVGGSSRDGDLIKEIFRYQG